MTRTSSLVGSRFVLVGATVAFVAACSDPVTVGTSAPPPAARPPAAPVGTQAAPGPTAETQVLDAGVDGGGPRAYRDDDFVELDIIHRDPFRDFVLSMAAQTPIANPRQVKMRTVSLDQMRLIAVITGVPVPYAMIVDPEGVGHVVLRGDYIGREEVVNAGGADGMPVALNWKIDRIRPGEVVLSREDPLRPDQPPLMRSLLLRDAANEGDLGVGVVQGQLGNTGDTTSSQAVEAPSPNAPSPSSAPGPATQRTSRSGDEAPAGLPPPASAPAPAESTSRFGGVFGRRP